MKKNMPEIYIREKRGVLITSSLDVAEKFQKRHSHVLDSIRKIIADSEGFGQPNFRESSYLNDQNKRQPMFEMTRDGFSVLAMGFSGKKALAWKVKYTTAFSLMEEVIRNQHNPKTIDNRNQGNISRRAETDTIRDFIEYARAQGSTRAEFYYKHITMATYRALFIIKDKFPGSLRDMLNSIQLSYLSAAENVASEAIRDGMAHGLYYKDIYLVAKNRLEKCAEAFGVTRVIDSRKQFIPGRQQNLLEQRA